MRIPFRPVDSSHRETHRKNERPERLVMRNALGKALCASLPRSAAAAKGRTVLVLGSDTIVYLRGRVLGKPAGLAEAVRMLGGLAGRTHDVFSGVALVHPASGKKWTGYARTRVRLKKWRADKLRDYAVAHSLDKAGAYGIQAKPAVVQSYRGSYTNVVGLPKELLLRMLRKAARELHED